MNKVWKNLISNVKREKFMAISNVAVMTITFVLLGLFIIIVAVSQTSLRYLEQQAQITLFFKDDVPEAKIFEIKTEIEKDTRVMSVNYISKDEAFRIFSEINKDEPILLESISPSLLPASLEIKSKNLGDLPNLSEEYSTIDGLEELRFFKDVVERFRFWSNLVYVIGFVLVAAFMMISYSVVIATLRATIHSKGIELEIMKLVGATDSYVKKPLMYQGMLFGGVSGLIAGLVVLLLGILATSFGVFEQGLTFGFSGGFFVSPLIFSIVLFFVLFVSGIGLGYLGSITAIKKYLNY